MSNNEPKIALVPVVCGVVLEQDGKYLLVQEKQPKAYGTWNLPAGRVDEGESLEEAAVREAREETGFNVVLEQHVQVLHTDMSKSVLHAYKARIESGSLSFPKDELLDARWFSLDEIRTMESELRDIDYVLGSIEAAL